MAVRNMADEIQYGYCGLQIIKIHWIKKEVKRYKTEEREEMQKKKRRCGRKKKALQKKKKSVMDD